jgi:hypothetical protein
VKGDVSGIFTSGLSILIFFQKLAKIFTTQGASPVSLTLENLPPASVQLVNCDQVASKEMWPNHLIIFLTFFTTGVDFNVSEPWVSNIFSNVRPPPPPLPSALFLGLPVCQPV